MKFMLFTGSETCEMFRSDVEAQKRFKTLQRQQVSCVLVSEYAGRYEIAAALQGHSSYRTLLSLDEVVFILKNTLKLA